MAGMEIDITVGSADVNVSEMLADSGNWKVKHSAGACAPCRTNEDPNLVPFPGCRSNWGGENGCKCTVEYDDEHG